MRCFQQAGDTFARLQSNFFLFMSSRTTESQEIRAFGAVSESEDAEQCGKSVDRTGGATFVIYGKCEVDAL